MRCPFLSVVWKATLITETPLIVDNNTSCEQNGHWYLLPVLDVESEQTLAALQRVVTALEGLGDVTTVLRVQILLHCNNNNNNNNNNNALLCMSRHSPAGCRPQLNHQIYNWRESCKVLKWDNKQLCNVRISTYNMFNVRISTNYMCNVRISTFNINTICRLTVAQ